MKDVHGQAIKDYYRGKLKSPLILHNSYGEPEEMPVEVFFRDELDFTTLEHLALMECKGTVLDIGAGAGAHSLALQGRNLEVHALENSPGCVDVMQLSGVRHVIYADYRKHHKKYDTLLLLMNGLGIAGRLKDVPAFFQKCIRLLRSGGQILIDSSDISYLYEGVLPDTGAYYGDVRYQYEYRGQKSDWFDWVYVDQHTLIQLAGEYGFEVEILMTDENDQYLARLIKRNM